MAIISMFMFSILLLQTAVFSSITPPEGNSKALEVKGRGVQIYKCEGSSGELSWVLQRAKAKLYDLGHKNILGYHYFLHRPDAGGGKATWFLIASPQAKTPTSTLTGKPIANVTNGSGNIDLLLVEATSHSGLSKYSYVQRIDTKGGVPPGVDRCTVKGLTRSIPYESRYVFWSEQNTEYQYEYMPTSAHAVLSVLFAEGFQHYTYNGTTWQVTNATAALSSVPGEEVVGHHYFDSVSRQPTWLVNYGQPSFVSGKAVKTLRGSTQDDISWVELEATNKSSNTYFLGSVTLIQRRSTRGGLPPVIFTSSPKAGDVYLSPYTAVYWFYW